MENSDLRERTKLFALRCIKLALVLPKSKLGNHVSGQLIRSSTSVASNYRAVKLAQTKAAFIAKLSIVIEEADSPCEIGNEEHASTNDDLVFHRVDQLSGWK